MAQHREPGGVDAVGRDGRVHRRGDVRGREAQPAAAAVAADDDALHAVRPAQRLGRGHHVTGVHAGPDIGGRERDGLGPVMLGHQRDALDSEPEALAGLAQQRHVAAGLLAEGEVLTDHDLEDVQAFDQQLVHVALGVSFMKSVVNGMTRNTSTPSSSTSSARRVSVVSCAG